MPRREPRRRRETEKAKSKPAGRYRHYRHLLWKSAFFAIAFTLAVGGIVWDAVFCAPLRRVETVCVPSLTGKTEAALSALDTECFECEIEYRYDQAAPAGTILSQDLSPGRECRVIPGERKRQIHVVVSLGKKYVTLRNFRGVDHRLAEQTLRGQGFEVQTIYEHNRQIAAGFVIATDPAAGALPVGATILLYVSAGE